MSVKTLRGKIAASGLIGTGVFPALFFSKPLCLSTLIFFFALGMFSSCTNNPFSGSESNAPPKVLLQPFEHFPQDDLQRLTSSVDSFYAIDLQVAKVIELPSSAFYPPRQRYRADSLIRYLRNIQSDSIDFTVGLTSKDISITKGKYKDWGVFGLGFRPGPSCVISTFRLRRKAKSEQHFQERLLKVTLHEIGHNLGLEHCENSKLCLMRDAEGKISTVDEEAVDLCDKCRTQIASFLP